MIELAVARLTFVPRDSTIAVGAEKVPNENVEDVAPPTVKMVCVDNDTLVSDQVYYIKLTRNTSSQQLCTLLGLSICRYKEL